LQTFGVNAAAYCVCTALSTLLLQFQLGTSENVMMHQDARQMCRYVLLQ